MKKTYFKAKSDGTLLIEHSKNVSYVALKIAELSNIKEQYKEPIRLGGLLHDIGKACSSFQDLINNPYKEHVLKNKKNYRHNEIGWAFIRIFFNSNHINVVSESVYWHHGISNKMGEYSIANVMKDISEYDKESMLWVLETLVGADKIREKDVLSIKAPSYFCGIECENDLNPDNLIIRSCIIAADHFVSSLGKSELTDEKIKEYYDTVILKKNKDKIDFNHIYDNERSKKQIEISENENKTLIVKAPAGFGKTLSGIMWSMKSNNKLLWVCPRNVIAESVYHSILSEISNVENNLTVELYLSGEVQESHNHVSNGFESDIIVTNIDNFLKPTFDLCNSDKIIQIMKCDVVFDEFHEFQTQLALFACFVNIMKVRTRIDCRTILLSATPSIIHTKWDSIKEVNTILPNKEEHFVAAHNQRYTLHVLKSGDIDNIKENSLTMFNAINKCQEAKKGIKESILIHSKYEKNHRKNIMDEILSIYGKNKETNKTKLPLISAPVLQAGLDISVGELYESMISPESTLQRIGRINRWGEMDNCDIYIYDMSNDSGERACINNFYNIELMKLWFETLKKYDGESLTLKEIYDIYNKFNIDNFSKIKSHIDIVYANSLNEHLVKHVYPYKFNESKSKNDIMTAGSNKLRISGLEVFYIVKKSDGTYTEPFSKKVEGGKFDDSFNENSKSVNIMIKEMEKIHESGDERFDYSELLNKHINHKESMLDVMRRYARKSNTPYIYVNGEYDDILGVIKK